MDQLYQRLSNSQLQLHQSSGPACARCGSPNHPDCLIASTAPSKEKRRLTSSRQRISRPVVTRMAIKSSSQSQLVVMRSKAIRKNSSSNNDSSAIRSPPVSACASQPFSPISKYVIVVPVELPATGVIKGTMGVAPPLRKQKIGSFNDSRSSTRSPDYKLHEPDHYSHYPTTQTLNDAAALKVHTPLQEKKTVPQPTPLVVAFPVKRRIEKSTPSSYTFASDSTKLGEIPHRHWNRPWDHEEAVRLNAETAIIDHPVQLAVSEKTTKKKWIFRFLRRGSAVSTATVA